MPLLKSKQGNDMQAAKSVQRRLTNSSIAVKDEKAVKEEITFHDKTLSKFDASNFKVLYEELMGSKKGREIFQRYLKEVACGEESILFLNTMDELREDFDHMKELQGERSKKQLKQYFEKVSTVIENFIRNHGLNELNLPKCTKESILNHFDGEIEPQVSRILSQYSSKKSSRASSPSTPKPPSYSTNSSTNSSTTSVANESNNTNDNTRSLESVLEQEVMNSLSIVDPDQLFGNIILAINIDLKLDSFPRFSRSKQLLEFLNKQGEAFTRTIAINISRGFNVDIRFKPTDLRRKNFIYDQDIYFALGLVEDSPDWENLLCPQLSEYAQIYFSKTSYSFEENNQGMKLYKLSTILPYKLEDVWTVFCDLQGRESDKEALTENRPLAYFAPNKATCNGVLDQKTNPLAIQYATSCFSLMLPGFKKREYTRTFTAVHDQELDAYIKVGHTTELHCYSTPEGRIPSDMFYFYIMYRIGENTTRLVHVVYSDMHTPQFMDRMFAKLHWRKRTVKIEQTLLENLKKYTENKSVEEMHDYFNLQSLVLDNQQTYSQRSWYREYKSLFK